MRGVYFLSVYPWALCRVDTTFDRGATQIPVLIQFTQGRLGLAAMLQNDQLKGLSGNAAAFYHFIGLWSDVGTGHCPCFRIPCRCSCPRSAEAWDHMLRVGG